jgi:hypothetical protein
MQLFRLLIYSVLKAFLLSKLGNLHPRNVYNLILIFCGGKILPSFNSGFVFGGKRWLWIGTEPRRPTRTRQSCLTNRTNEIVGPEALESWNRWSGREHRSKSLHNGGSGSLWEHYRLPTHLIKTHIRNPLGQIPLRPFITDKEFHVVLAVLPVVSQEFTLYCLLDTFSYTETLDLTEMDWVMP